MLVIKAVTVFPGIAKYYVNFGDGEIETWTYSSGPDYVVYTFVGFAIRIQP